MLKYYSYSIVNFNTNVNINYQILLMNKKLDMKKVNFKKHPVTLSGNLPLLGVAAPSFSLVKTDLATISLEDFKGKTLVLNIFPSLDTGVCATSVRKFNQLAANMKDTLVLAISKDLPFAHSRFCTTEGIENVIPLSDFRNTSFSKDYGLLMEDGPLQGLLARAVVIIDPDQIVRYVQLVPEITQEPDYDEVLRHL